MRKASDIIQDLGGPLALAKATGIPYTTILGWRDSNFIPEWRRPCLLDLAEQAKTPLAEDDFPPIEARIPRSKRQAAA